MQHARPSRLSFMLRVLAIGGALAAIGLYVVGEADAAVFGSYEGY